MLSVMGALRKRFARGKFLCVSGGLSQAYMAWPRWIKRYVLPYPFASRDDFRAIAAVDPATAQRRAQACLEIVKKELPDVFLTEYFPLGRPSSRQELLPSLLSLARARARVCSVAGYPIMPRQSRAWIVSDMKLYEKIFILCPRIEMEYFEKAYARAGDRRVYRTFFDRYARQIVFTNYLPSHPLPFRKPSGDVGGESLLLRKGAVHVAVVRGGGAYYWEILKASLEAGDILGPEFFFTLVAGPATTDDEWALLSAVMSRKKIKNACLLRQTSSYEGIMARSDVCVATASYHTSVMLMRHKKKAVIIPFEGYGNIDFPEQRARARMLEDVLGSRTLRFPALSAKALAGQIRKAAAMPPVRPVPGAWFSGAEHFIAGLTALMKGALIVVLFMISAHAALAAPEQGVDAWKLAAFEAVVKDDPSLCGTDEYCLKHEGYYRSLLCVDRVCRGVEKGKTPAACAPEFAAQYSQEQEGPINAALCALLKDPGVASRRAYLDLVVDEGEDEAVELGGYLMAMKGSAAACANYIKDYVGPYGPRWGFAWYRSLSGCRILARVRTRVQEEKDFNAWLGAVQGAGRCSGIAGREMRRACKAHSAASPAPAYDQLW